PEGTLEALELNDGIAGAIGVVGGGIAGIEGGFGEKFIEFLFGLPDGTSGVERAEEAEFDVFEFGCEICFNLGI
ncbi:hypothetical protein B9K06_27125, partial [Bacillus sp. OG2]